MNMEQKMKQAFITIPIALLVLIWSSTQATAQQRFTVYTPEGVVEPGGRVELRGSLAELGAWEEGLVMKNQNGRKVWSVEVSVPDTTSTFEYKFAIVRKGGAVEWESGHNRSWNAGTGVSEEVPMFRGYEADILQNKISWKIIFNTSGMTVNGFSPEQVAILGGRLPLGWDLEKDRILLDQESDSTWSTVLTLDRNSPVDIEFKLAWQADGVWYWEYQPGHINHLLLADKNAQMITLTLAYNLETSRVVAVEAIGGEADGYAKAAEAYGTTRKFGYYQAVTELETGDLQKARETYTKHRAAYAPVNVDDIDDFDFLWAHSLANQGMLAEALAFAEEKGQSDPVSWRRTYFQYLKGELLLNAGRNEEAQEFLEKALELSETADQGKMIEGYAHLGMARTYLESRDPEQRSKARGHLRRLAYTHPDPQTQRIAWRNLAELGEQNHDEKELTRALKGLSEAGSDRQKTRSRLKWLSHRMDTEELDSVYSDIQWMEWTVTNQELAEEVQLLKSEYFMRSGQEEHGAAILKEIAERGSGSDASERARLQFNRLPQELKDRAVRARSRNVPETPGTNRIPQNAASADSTSNGGQR